MFNTAGKQSITLDNFGGLITEAPPESLPEGASPLCYDVDFPIAAVTSRPGLATQLNAGVARNFVYVKTLEALDGVIRTLCLDSSGELWLENVTASAGTLTAIAAFTPGDYAKSTSAFNREYICLSNPSGGYDTPWQYNAPYGWLDRISQEGPGANAIAIVPASNTSSFAITAFSITSNVVTFTAVNSLAAGSIVAISGLSIGTYLNGAVLTVLSAGLSGTQFEANFTYAPGNVPTTVDSGTATLVTSFAISSITQPAAVSIGAAEWSSGPSSSPVNAASNPSAIGTTITIYYSTVAADVNITNAFTKGIAVYVYLTGMPAPFPQGTYQVISAGLEPSISGGGWYYFCVTAATPAYAFHKVAGMTGTYQVTLGTVVTSSPVPGVVIGGQVSVQGATPSSWNNTWSVVDTQQSGVLSITQTSMAASGGPLNSVATYSFTLDSGNAPVAGDLVTVSNTTNGNGIFNVINATIASVVGSTFTIAGFNSPSIAAQAESGGAETFGKYISIDPGATYVSLPGTQSPIFGSDSGAGTVTALGITLNIGGGTRQMVTGGITRNGYLTKPSPPITFTSTGLQQSITITNLPIGPPSWIGRYVAFTEAGANGIPGAFFYYIPLPVQSIVNGQPYTYSSTVVNDNVSTTATFTFTDAVLLASTEIDVPGNDLFSLRELGNSRWAIQYANRMFYGLEQNKVTNFVNMTFNGGYQSGTSFPLGWTADATYGAGGSLVLASNGDGQSYYILNSSGSTQSFYAMITQPAFEDAYGVPIIEPNTAYSVRVLVRCPSGNTAGNLVVDLVSFDKRLGYGTSYGSAVIPFSSLTTTLSWKTITLLTAKLATTPSTLVLRVYTTGIASEADCEVKRVEVFDASQPVLATEVTASYVNQPEAIDDTTGAVGLAERNSQPVNGAFVMYDNLYFLKAASMYVTKDSDGDEPSEWDVKEVSNRVGTCSIYSYDVGEEWMATACREGVFVFTGGPPVKISQEIQKVWDSINWSAAGTIWLRNDIENRRISIGVPMATPNAYLPFAPVNANPTTPNVVITLNYVGIGMPQELASLSQLHVTMFGTLVSADMRRKWTIWQIASPYADFVTRQDGVSKPLFLCNSNSSGKIYALSSTQYTDDGAQIYSLYTTYGFVNSGMAKQNPLLGFHRKLFTYLQLNAYGGGQLLVNFLANTLNANAQHQWSVLSPLGGIALQANPVDDIERSINIAGNRVFVQFQTNGLGTYFTLSKLILVGGPHPFVPLRGSASA